ALQLLGTTAAVAGSRIWLCKYRSFSTPPPKRLVEAALISSLRSSLSLDRPDPTLKLFGSDETCPDPTPVAVP
ncbi:hypothetical protein ACR2V7_25825, partial [Klebsiella pneumoniae]